MKMWLASVVSIGLIASCGKKREDGGGSTGTAGTASGGGAASARKITINGSGSTFQKAYQEIAIETYANAHGEVTVNYGGGGSGKGRQDFADMVTDFGCTDAPFKDAEKSKIKGGELVYVPVLLGAISVSYNVPEIEKLQLSAETLAKIFQREIKKWNDPAIAQDNPGAKLPATDIVVAHRSDGSGTTANFTLFLTKAAGAAWKLKSGSTVEWSADTQAGNGNSGVAQIVKSTHGAIGYVDLPDAKASGLKYAAIKNQAGKYVEPTPESTQAAGEGIEVKDDLTFEAVNAKGDAAYPITAQSWCMAYTKPADQAKGGAVKAYYKYLVTDGQGLLKEIDFAPLPKTLQDKAIAQVEKIQI
ncbi:MAG TPA: phosphate ABC transporter substrate-binding protein PstS [Kofleriaceae bacterium]|nr:phosphate ABC transporter substrate-binding protein PstS [Kofleriaceae bacterium]